MTHSLYPALRMRRMRKHPRLRELMRETHLSTSDLVFPLFIKSGTQVRDPIASMPGQSQISVDQLSAEIAHLMALGIPAVLLFGVPPYKDAEGSASWQPDGVIQEAIRVIKEQAPELLVMVDVCFCSYMDHGHCGHITEQNGQYSVDNDATLPLLVKQAVSFAAAGADVIAPSGMMDGMVSAIRQGLDQAGYLDISILSYAVKYSSALYGPFRQAAEGAPQFGDRQAYQMDFANQEEALREAALDVAEGVDMLMVKPAHTYLDVICRIKQAHPGIALGAYHVSGEYSMIKAAAAQGWIDEKRVVLEVITAIKRAGADFIITYFAKDVAEWIGKA